ncbi:TPA: ATPase [Candidatus Gastranaerophilales bacterium HUM_19]|nr:MAG TPA: ATPase [Candidatus Gastranaerophilales bacterium HUM_17]DAB20051.1 MAG TPA: ATPase [Candidatus Gastranaerophilales bacterium HUM_19]DAB24733.1 MAG TPA: ATPase [Candidatus Gastranaerophilales bacterium HUM_23]
MQRYALKHLINWKNKKNHKPLVIQGARQVGKTWLMQEFGKKYYEQVAYINFDVDLKSREIFDVDYDTERLIMDIGLATKTKINAENTLIIFDEIQECPRALTSLKYFRENAPQYDIIVAGSLLGVACHEGTGFPVGKVSFMNLFPLSFEEFLLAMGEERFVELLNKKDFKTIKLFNNKYEKLLKQYCYVGGMPEIVQDFVENKDFESVRNLQKEIISAYEEDFTKHIPTNTVAKIRLLWKSIPAQLSKENKKFIYGAAKEGARARDFEAALSWLINSGLVYRVNKITKPDLPITAYEDFNSFKLFVLDVGLLGAMTDLQANTIIDGNRIFEEFKGAIAEQYVLQQFKTIKDLPVFYWSNETSRAEIDFVIQIKSDVVPVEVKAERNLQAKSLKVYMEKFKPNYAIRTSMADYKKTDNLIDLPLYTLENITQGDIK